ncbi:MAG: MupA/Atu3671 family FMN-dependent luciferase-like monooxygenase [Pseudomonadota bacterium]
MTQFSAVLVGNESLTIACGKALIARGHQITAVITHDVGVRDWAQHSGLACRDYDRPPEGHADWVLSVANLRILGPEILQLGSKGAVNFHDGPLPKYAGLNAPVWARLAGEARHGITWHLIAEGVDTGAIIAQEMFEIGPEDTALTLNTRCFEAGIVSFDRVMDALENGAQEAQPQDTSARSYFGRAHRPEGHGVIDSSKQAHEILRLVKALDHGDYWNPVCKPTLLIDGRAFYVSQAEVIAHDGQRPVPGTVLAAREEDIEVAVADAVLRVTGDFGGVPGGANARSYTPDQEDADAIKRAMQAEPDWRGRLADMAPAGLPLAQGRPNGVFREGVIETGAPDQLPAALYLLADRFAGGPADVALAQSADSPLLADWRPLRSLDDLGDVQLLPPFLADLPLRDPAIAAAQPALALSGGGPLQGSLATLDGTALHTDEGAVSPAAARLLSIRLAHIAECLQDGQPADEISLLGVKERALLAGWNATETDVPDTLLSQQIEAQAAANPDAEAVVVGQDSLSYQQLNTRANQVAHVLRDMGVGPDVLVGIYTPRSQEMIIGVLAILKAGGAYVPLDPAYPEARIAGYLEDSAVPVILTTSAVTSGLPDHAAKVLELDRAPQIDAASAENPPVLAKSTDLAYLIFTSGSTGRPKGVMIEHGNLMNFCAGMDARLAHDPAGCWLAVTSLNFDISVLELLYTLSRGFKVVVTSGEASLLISDGPVMRNTGGMDFSVYYWGNDDAAGEKKYELLLEGAKFADAHGFCAVWTPERHFHAFGGPYPNPSVTGAAVAAATKNIGVRAGSCVGPLHHPARIAEEWAVIDNLTNGRAGLAIASGWQPDDFVLRPENTPPDNKPAMTETIESLRRLWRGEPVPFPRKDGTMHEVITQPRPVSKEVPIWVTTAGNPDTWREAGRLGANVLTHLLGQSMQEVRGKIEIYHAALREAGIDPAERSVTLMLHTFLADTRDQAREIAREPMKDYLRSAAGLIKQYAWAFPAFKKPEGVTNPFELDLGSLEDDELEGILDFAFQRYFDDSGLFGTVEDALARVQDAQAIGVTEIACLIDYGIATPTVLDGMKLLAKVVAGANTEQELRADDVTIAAQLVRHNATHLQCTPSMARMITQDPDARGAMRGLKHIMVGGEALPGALVADLRDAAPEAQVLNMYGPTETTIWSSTNIAEAVPGTVGLGQPVANTQFHVLDDDHAPVAIGEEGELCIGGAGVARGYWQRADLTAERFIDTSMGRLYRTGDLVRWTAEGELEFLGRVDHQIKLRGYRIELGEIEAALEAQSGVRQAVVTAREDTPGDIRLVGYVTGEVAPEVLRRALGASLPPHMVPAHIECVDSFPLTPNKKVDRAALPAPKAAQAPASVVATLPAGGSSATLEAQIADIWQRILGVSGVKGSDNFFDLGGHSLLAVQAHREMRDALGAALSITDIFRFPVLSALAAQVASLGGVAANAPSEPPHAAASAGSDRAAMRAAAMSKRRAMRAARTRK